MSWLSSCPSDVALSRAYSNREDTIARHAGSCPSCGASWRAMAELSQLGRSLPTEAPTRERVERSRANIQRRLRLAGPARGARPSLAWRFGWATMAVTVAAAATVVAVQAPRLFHPTSPLALMPDLGLTSSKVAPLAAEKQLEPVPPSVDPVGSVPEHPRPDVEPAAPIDKPRSEERELPKPVPEHIAPARGAGRSEVQGAVEANEPTSASTRRAADKPMETPTSASSAEVVPGETKADLSERKLERREQKADNRDVRREKRVDRDERKLERREQRRAH